MENNYGPKEKIASGCVKNCLVIYEPATQSKQSTKRFINSLPVFNRHRITAFDNNLLNFANNFSVLVFKHKEAKERLIYFVAFSIWWSGVPLLLLYLFRFNFVVV